MRSASEEGRAPVWPLLLAIAAGVSGFVFVLGLVSFLLRDVQFVDAPLTRPTTPTAPAGDGLPATTEEPLGEAGLRSAVTAVAPLVPICLAEARARDPSVPSVVTLQAELVASAESGVVRALRVKSGASPFLQHCFNKRGVGAQFPVGHLGRATVLWRASVKDGAGVLEAID